MALRFSPGARFTALTAGLAAISAGLSAYHLRLQSRELPFLGHPVLDAAVYHEWAAGIAAGRETVTGPYYQSPGYPQILGRLYFLTGPDPMAAVYFQTALGVVTLVLTALLGRRLFGSGRGVLAAAMLLFLVPLYFFEVKLLDVSVSVLLATLAVYLSVRGEDMLREEFPGGEDAGRRPWRRTIIVFFLAGYAAGRLAVVRANLLVFPLGLFLWWGWLVVRRRRRYSPVVAFLVGALLPLVPTTIHNASLGAWVPVATSGGFNFYLGNFRGATGVFADVPGTSGSIATQEAEADSLVQADLGRFLEPAAESRYWIRRAFAEIAEDPLPWLGLLGKKAWLYLGSQEQTNNGSLELERSRIGWLRAAALSWNVLFVLAMVGAVFVWRGRGVERGEPVGRRSFAAPIVLVAATVITCLGFFVLTRLRLPAAPVLAVFAAHALVAIFRRWREGPRRERLQLVGLLTAMLAFVSVTSQSPLSAGRNPTWEANLMMNAARSLEREGHPENARAAYELARDLDPSSVEALLALGEIAVARGDLDEAIRFYESARSLDPERYRVRTNLGILYFHAGRWAACDAEMDAAARLDPTEATPLLYRGLAARKMGDSGWEGWLERALERDPRSAPAYTALIEGALEEGDTASARAWVSRAEAAGAALAPHILPRP